MIYRYHPKPWHFSGPIFTSMIGFAILHHFGYGLDFLYLALCLGVVVLCWSVWIALAGIIQASIDRHEEITGEEWTAPKEHVYDSTQVTQESDKRWRQWAYEVTNNRAAIARDLWIGSGNLFSRDEYDVKMDDLKKRRVLKFANGQTVNNGYAVNGAGGWEYLKAMSEGRTYLPLPAGIDLQSVDSHE